MPRTTGVKDSYKTVYASGFSCLRSLSGDTVRVTVAGELLVGALPRFKDALDQAQTSAACVVLDLRRLEAIDAGGAQLLLAADRRIRRAGGRFVVVRGDALLDWMLDRAGIGDTLEWVDRLPVPGAGGDHRAGREPAGTEPLTREPTVPTEAQSATASRLVSTTAECAELRARVRNLEQELLDLVLLEPRGRAVVEAPLSPA